MSIDLLNCAISTNSHLSHHRVFLMPHEISALVICCVEHYGNIWGLIHLFAAVCSLLRTNRLQSTLFRIQCRHRFHLKIQTNRTQKNYEINLSDSFVTSFVKQNIEKKSKFFEIEKKQTNEQAAKLPSQIGMSNYRLPFIPFSIPHTQQFIIKHVRC